VIFTLQSLPGVTNKVTGDGTENARYVLPVAGDKDGVMTHGTLTKTLRTLGYIGDMMTGHDFRSIASTLLNEQLCWQPDAIERQLAHAARNKVRAAYNYAEYLPKRRSMLQAWADHLDGLPAEAFERTQHKLKAQAGRASRCGVAGRLSWHRSAHAYQPRRVHCNTARVSTIQPRITSTWEKSIDCSKHRLN